MKITNYKECPRCKLPVLRIETWANYRAIYYVHSREIDTAGNYQVDACKEVMKARNAEDGAIYRLSLNNRLDCEFCKNPALSLETWTVNDSPSGTYSVHEATVDETGIFHINKYCSSKLEAKKNPVEDTAKVPHSGIW